MPELPEVHTVVQQLHRLLTGKTIAAVTVKKPNMVTGAVAGFVRQLTGQKITAVQRRAKVIIIRLQGDSVVLAHLKMTGQLIVTKPGGTIASVGGHPIPGGLEQLPNKYSHITITCTDGTTLFFNDQRQFGWMKVVPVSDLALLDEQHGIEPLTKQFDFAHFNTLLERYPKRPIKQLLLDQKLIAGIGNIYADESCFAAKVLPSRPAGDIKTPQRKALWRAIPRILQLSIKHGGTTTDQFRQATGQKGGFMPFLKVYGRAGQPCPRCKAPIRKVQQAGRGTHFCPQCQG